MKVIFTAVALAALARAMPVNSVRQFQVGPPSTTFPDPITGPPATLPPDIPIILPPITGPVIIGKTDAETNGKDDEFIIFPPVTGPLIPDKPVGGGAIIPDPTIPGGPLKPSN